MKIDLVDQETGRPVDRVGERIGPVSLVSRFPGLPVYRATQPAIFIRIGTGMSAIGLL